jgi:hypothetical protein
MESEEKLKSGPTVSVDQPIDEISRVGSAGLQICKPLLGKHVPNEPGLESVVIHLENGA